MPRNLLFDLGGVIMDIRRDDCLEAFRSLGMEHPENLIGEYVQNGPFGQLEFGRDFGRTVPRRPPGTAPRRGHRPADRPRFLRIHHRTPPATACRTAPPAQASRSVSAEQHQPHHVARRHRRGVSQGGTASRRLLRRHRHIIRSQMHETRRAHIPPRGGIVRHPPEETLFLDDSQANLEAAARLGYKTMLVAPGTEFADLLAAEGIA